MTRRERLVAWFLISLGIEAAVYFLSWWASPGEIASLPLFVLFSAVGWFSVFRMVANWFALAHVERPEHRMPPPGRRVDVFTTAAPGEPFGMIETTLRALLAMRYPHETYLLDDSQRDELRDLCGTLGVHYIRRERPGEGGKAGNINHALALSSGEFVAIFDPDHVPVPEFLERVLGYFADPRVGYVQAAQAYRNQHESIVARGAAEQTYELYGPTMMGLYGLGAPLLFGCHTTFRRAALDSINGYAIHNAEDLRTCMRLTARGWKGVYVPEILARGLVPADLTTFMRQQYRWANSVLDLLFRDFWRMLPSWSVYQAATFFMAGTYYFVGVAVLVNLFLPPLFLLTEWRAATGTASSFLAHLAPLVLVNAVIRRYGQRFLLDPSERGWHLAGTLMLFAGCFAHATGLFAALGRVHVPYIVTAKERRRTASVRLMLPHLAVAAASVVGVLYGLWEGRAEDWLIEICALWNAGMMAGVIFIAIDEEGMAHARRADVNGALRALRRLGRGPLVGDRLER